jgi:membrane protein
MQGRKNIQKKNSVKHTYQRVLKFLLVDIWHLDLSELSIMKARMIKYLKVLIITIRGVSSDKVGRQANSLSYFSAMSIVPFVAISFAITNGFGYGSSFEELIYEYFQGNELIIGYLMKFAGNLVATLENGIFGIINFLLLISVIIYLMLNIEKSFNEIWKVENPRSFHKRLAYYLLLLVVAPLVVIVFLSLGLLYSNALKSIGLEIDKIVPVTSFFTWLSFYVVVTMVFTIMYFLIPNTKVKFAAAFNSALIVGLAFVVVQFFYLETQLMVTGMNTVYGVFAAIPLFLIWINISWTIILFGAELSKAYQYVDNLIADDE